MFRRIAINPILVMIARAPRILHGAQTHVGKSWSRRRRRAGIDHGRPLGRSARRAFLGYAEGVGELTTPPPRIRRLEVPRPSFDFLDFDEARRLGRLLPRRG
jgi:hypothetical protein